METKKFKTETKKLLDLMINSIYTHKEIFLRELVSNASDAIDKRHYLSLTNANLVPTSEYQISIDTDKEARTITITDNGIGMSHDDLVNSLGTIAKSGSKEFMENITSEENKGELDIIGQFGVGFYSAYMVADKVEVKTKKALENEAYMFVSDGTESYTIDTCDKANAGTEITLYLRENTEDENYDTYLEFYTIKSLIKKYSDYVRYPIRMMNTKEVPNEDNPEETNEVTELETLNSMIPLWKKSKSEVTEEELNSFYKSKFGDYEDPLTSIFTNVEGNITYNSICYIPKHAPYDMYSDSYERGLQLYTKGVFILDKCKELVPNYLRFVKGLVDSADLSLNISREMLQHDRQLTKIATSLEKKILAELSRILKNDRAKYEEFFTTFGVNLKYGCYEDFGMRKDSLKDLLLFKSLNSDSYITLKEYVDAMKEGQDVIYFASGKSKASIMALPQMDAVKKQGFDVLILTDDIDEFLMMVLQEYETKKFKNVNQGDLDLLNEEEKKEFEALETEKKPLVEALQEALKDKVKEVKLSKRLTDSAVCLVSGDGVSFEMERVLSEMPNQQEGVKADRILEINPKHQLFEAIEHVYNNSNEDVKKYAEMLYSQALIIEGIPLEDPIAFSNLMCDLMIKASK